MSTIHKPVIKSVDINRITARVEFSHESAGYPPTAFSAMWSHDCDVNEEAFSRSFDISKGESLNLENVLNFLEHPGIFFICNETGKYDNAQKTQEEKELLAQCKVHLAVNGERLICFRTGVGLPIEIYPNCTYQLQAEHDSRVRITVLPKMK